MHVALTRAPHVQTSGRNCAHHVYCFPLLFKNGEGVLRICDCGKMASAWTLLDGMDTTYSEFEHVQSSITFCQHSLAIKGLQDAKHIAYETPIDCPQFCRIGDVLFECLDSPISFLKISPSSKPILSINFDNLHPSESDRITVYPKEQAATKRFFFTCGQCPTNSHQKCPHIQKLRELSQSIDIGLDNNELSDVQFFSSPQTAVPNHLEFYLEQIESSTSCISYLSIQRSGSHPEILRRGMCRGSSIVRCRESCVDCTHCVPAIPTEGPHVSCQCGAPWSDEDPVENNWVTRDKATLTTLTCTMQVTVYYRKCSDCCERLAYDGGHDGIFNLSNISLFTHESMFAFWDSMIKQRYTFAAHYNSLFDSHQRSGTSKLMPTRNVVRYALQGFLSLLNMPYEHLMSCPLCSKLPSNQQIIIMDGTALGFNRQNAFTGVQVQHDPVLFSDE